MHTDDSMVSATIQQIRQHFPRLGVHLPDGMAAALNQIDAEKDEPGFTVDPSTLRAAVDAARAAGEDPADDEDVRTELVRYQLASLNLGPAPAGRAERRAALLHEHADAIVAVLQEVVAEGDSVLGRVRAAGVDPAAAAVNGSNRAVWWEQGQEALTRITHAGKMWGLLVAAFRLADRPTQYRALVLADLTPEQLFALDGHDLLAAARAGHPLALATPDEYTQRCQRIRRHHDNEAARLENERNGKRGIAAA